MKKSRITKTPISFILLLISLSIFFIITILSFYKLPPLSQPNNHSSYLLTQQTHLTIGPFGKMMIDMLPIDLPFTLFLPSESAFTQVLKMKVNESLADKQLNDTIAVLSRVLGFSVVPRGIRSGDVDMMEMEFESLSGFRLGVWKEEDGRLVVNGVRAEREEFSVGEVLVYVMNGVVMDAEFEQSFKEEDDDDE